MKHIMKSLWPIPIRKIIKYIINKILWYKQILSGKSYYFNRDINVKTIRIGNSLNAHYIVPPYSEDLMITVFSFGVGEDASFEQEILVKYNNAKIYAFDPTPRAINYVKTENLISDRLLFFPWGLEAYDGYTSFYLPTDDDPEPSGSVFKRERLYGGDILRVQMKRLVTIMKELDINQIDILKMDIEGSEFAVLEDIINSGVKINQICLEFHERIFKSSGKEKMKTAIRRLREHHYCCCFVSPRGRQSVFVLNKKSTN